MIEVSQQTLIFLQSCLLGFFLGILYDFFRILRMAIKSNGIIVFIEDFLFFILAAIITFSFMISNTHGQMRIFVIIGELLGAIIYYFTLGKLVIKIADKILTFIKKIIIFIFKLIILPIIKIIIKLNKLLFKIILKFKIKRKKIKQNNEYNLKKKKILLYNLIRKKNKNNKNLEKSSNGKIKNNT